MWTQHTSVQVIEGHQNSESCSKWIWISGIPLLSMFIWHKYSLRKHKTLIHTDPSTPRDPIGSNHEEHQLNCTRWMSNAVVCSQENWIGLHGVSTTSTCGFDSYESQGFQEQRGTARIARNSDLMRQTPEEFGHPSKFTRIAIQNMAVHGRQMTALYGRRLTSVRLRVNMSACFSRYGTRYRHTATV